jgi:hypothetical protein
MGKGGSSSTASLVNAIKTPLGVVLMLVICIVMAGLSIASAISGQLTAAAVSAAGLLVVVLLVAMLNAIGKS